MVQPPEQPRHDGADDLWLAYHEIWLQPLESLTVWWDAFVVPASSHHALHATRIAANQRLAVPKPVARDTEQNLFA